MDISSLVQTPASPTDQPTRKPYWQVLDEYRQFTNANRQFSDMSVPEFSQRMSAIHGDNSYDEGLTDNFARRAGANIELGLRHFGRAEPAYPGGPVLPSPTQALGGAPEYDLPKLAGQATEKAATGLGASPETAKKVGAVGETLPSTALDVGVGALVGAATGGVGAIPTMAGLAGLQTYGETGRLAPSALSAGTTALFPKAAEVGGQIALKAVGGKALSELSPKLLALLPKETAAEVGSDLVPQGIGQTLARIGGAQAGMLGLGLASETAQTAIRPGETWQDKLKQVGEQFSPSSLAATAVGQLPFTALDLASARAHPIKALESQVKDNFAQRFTEAYKAESGGAEPTQDQISLAMQKLMAQKPVSTETPVGQTLQSIAQTPVELDLKRPIQTTEGEWNVGDAIEATRLEAQNILRATPDVGDISQAHDLRLWAAVRAAQGEGATSKQELARNAAERFVSGLRGDNENLGRLSPDFARMEKDELVRQRNEKAQTATEAEITSKITPKLNDGTDNPLYDSSLATKVALVSGDVGHRMDVGIEQPVIMATRGGETVPLNSSIIDTVRGLVPKLGDERTTEVEALRNRIAEKDAEVDQIRKASGEELFDNPDLDHATGEAIQLRMMLDDLTGGKDLPVAGKTRAQQLTADATFAARRAALRYDKPFDLNNPQNVRDFYDYVKSAINTAERGWLRERMDQSIVTDAQGQAITFASRDAALARASVLNENVSEDEGTKYTVPEAPRPDGTFHILRNRYFRTTSITPQETGSPEAVHEVGRGEIPFDEKTQADESTTGIPTTTLDAVGATLKEIEREAITSRFRELAGLKDPAASEGRKAALAQNVIDFVSGLPDSTVARLMKEETGVSLREPALRKARFVKFMQFLRDGGDVKLAYDKSRPGLVKVKGEGNLDAMNEYFGDLGFANGRRFNERSKTSGMNFFEQFYVLSKLLQQEFVDPRSTASVETRPRGDFGWVPPGFKEKLDENKLTINWPKGYKKAVGVKQAQWADVPDAVKENAVIMRDREGNTKRFEVTKNPLQTMLVKGAKHDLLTSAGKLVEMIGKFAPDVDPDQLQLLKGLTDASAFIRNLNVGFGIAKDPSVRGYFHTDDFSSSAGVLLSPFTQDVTGRNVASLMAPKDIVPHFLHELGHSATQFAYVRDPAFKAEVDRVYNYVKQHHDELMQFASGGKFSQSQLHGLTNPVEMLASVWHDADLQNFLRKIKDPFDPLLEQQSVNVPVTMFDRVMGLIRSVLRKLVGGDGANSMLARVSELAARGLEVQKGLDLQSRGDIYSQLYGRGNIEGDVIRGAAPQAVPKPIESTSSRTFLPGYEGAPPEKEPSPTTVESRGALEVAEDQLDRAKARLNAMKNPALEGAYRHQFGGAAPEGQLAQAIRYPVTPDELARAEELVRIAQERVDQTKTTGQTLESRVPAATVLDSLKSASSYVTEDGDKLWFKPFDDKYFRSTYQSAFGNKMLLKQEGGQWGYELPKSALENIGPKQLLQMPRPKVRTWAPSAFETMKDLFKRQGSNDATAEALASYNLQFTALLKNSENAVWGKIEKPNDPSLLAMAWGKSRVGGLTPLSAENSQIAPTVMHEGAHLAGFNDVVDKYETPDVQAAVSNANQTFAELSGAERRSVLEGLVRLSDQTKGLSMGVYPKAMEDPTEFAAEFMGHVGDALGQVPNPSAYLKDVLRFAPDEVSNVATKTTLRRFQALDRLKQLVKDQAASRGLKSDLSPVIDKLTDTFKQLSRNALDIAVDQAEFYRMRGLYPDLYREKLKQASERLDNFANLQSDVEEPTPRLSGTIFQSRENDLSKTIRSFFTLPDNEGRLPTKPSMWDRTLMQFQQFAEKYPVARPFYDMLATEKGLARQRQIQLDTALAGAFEGAKAIDDKRTRQVVDFQRSQPLRDKFSKIALDINAYGDEKYRKALSAAEGDVFGVDPNAVTGFLTPEFVSGLMKKYAVSGKDLDAVNTVMTGTRNQIKLSSANIVGAKVASMERMLAEAIVRNTDLNPQAGREAAQLLSKAIQTQTTDFQGAQGALEEFTKTIPDANVRGRMFDFAQTSWEGIQRLERFLSLRMPYYMSERRPGQFGVFWKDAEDKVQSRYFADGKARDAYVQSNNIDPVRTTNPGDKNFGVSEDVFDQLDQLHQRMMEKLAGMVGEKDAKELGPVMDLGSELRNALGARDVLNLTTPRKGAKGREDLDMFDVHQHYIRAVNQAIRARSVREEAQLLSQAPEFANEPLIKQQIQNHVDQVLAPDSQLGKAVVRVNQLYYLFGNVSSMIMQTSHQLMALAPKLTENGASVAGSYGTILKANKMVVDARIKGRYTDPEIQRMIDLAGTRGDIGSWISQEIDHNEDLQAINRIRGTSGKSLWEPFDLLKNKTYQAMNVMQKMYGVVPAYNSEVGFVTALLHLRKTQPNLKGDELYNEARFLKDVTLYPGGKETRPGFFQASGSNQTSSFVLPRSAAQTVWSLNTYANGLTTMMGNLLRKSFNPKGLTPAQATQVRKAALQMFSTQIAVAGVLGLPFAQAMLYGLQQLFPDHNIEMGIRDTLAQLDGDGDAFGNLPSMLTTGIPSAMDYAPDLGSRFALAGTLHVSPYGGVGWQQLVGPVGGLVARLFHGVQAGARGEPMQTVQDLMPNGFQRLWKSLEQQNTYTSQSGKLLANDLRPEEVVARAIGFIPSRVSRIQDAERLSKITEDAEKSQQAQWASKQVGLVRQGRADEVRQNVAQRVAETQGARTAQELTGDVAREYERQTLPVDTRRLGSRATVLAQKSLKGVLGTQSNDVSNMQRLQTQQDVLTQLGGKPIHVGQFHRAGAVDNLLQLYPHLTTPQAEVLLAHSPASRPTPSLYEALTTGGE